MKKKYIYIFLIILLLIISTIFYKRWNDLANYCSNYANEQTKTNDTFAPATQEEKKFLAPNATMIELHERVLRSCERRQEFFSLSFN